MSHNLLTTIKTLLDGKVSPRVTRNDIHVLKTRVEIVERVFGQIFVTGSLGQDVLGIDTMDTLQALYTIWSKEDTANGIASPTEYARANEPPVLDRYCFALTNDGDTHLVVTWLLELNVWFKHERSETPGRHYITVGGAMHKNLTAFCGTHKIKVD